jgi:hypothetical protein
MVEAPRQERTMTASDRFSLTSLPPVSQPNQVTIFGLATTLSDRDIVEQASQRAVCQRGECDK